jgi:hypothetical protein
MTTSEFSKIAGRLMRHPAAPFHEHAVRGEVESFCKEHGLEFKRDKFGNVIVRLRTAAKVRPFVLAAHMDHPGFEIVRQLSAKCWLARFLGGVPDDYFRPGVPVRLMPGGIAAKVGRRPGKAKEFELHMKQAAKGPAEFAVWELEDFAVKDGRIHGRACDDLIGVASILATLIELKRSRARVNVIGVIARAEEIGFFGRDGRGGEQLVAEKFAGGVAGDESRTAGRKDGAGRDIARGGSHFDFRFGSDALSGGSRGGIKIAEEEFSISARVDERRDLRGDGLPGIWFSDGCGVRGAGQLS